MSEHVRVHVRTSAQVLGISLAWALLLTASPADPHESSATAVGASARRATLANLKVKPLGGARSDAADGNACPVDRPRRWLPGDWRPRPYRRGVDGRSAPLRAHLGIDIFAPRGTPVRAPFDGVLRRGRDRRGGRWFRLFGKNGYAFGSHMHAFAAKEGWVRAGALIGYVGNTGNARYTSPHLHFEWHPQRKRAVDPERLLRQRCGGPTRRYVR